MSSPQSIFRVGNKHSAASGSPPQVDGDERGRYYSYFENEFGEQAVFVYDYETQTGTLYMGDLGWDQPVTIKEDSRSDLVLNDVEALWLGACWMAATGQRSR